jgi:superfamily II DNA or RNA helicase
VKAIFAVWKESQKEFGFLKKDLKPFIEYCEFAGGPLDKRNIGNRELYTPHPIVNVMKPEFQPREKQKPAVEFLSKKEALNRVVDAATGFGKSFLGMNTAFNNEERTGFIMEPGHIKTWLESIDEQTNLDKKKKVCVVQGSHQLRALFEMQKQGLMDYDLIFFSAPTIREYIKNYENDVTEDFDQLEGAPSVQTFDVKPYDMFEFLKIGTIIRDEVHESIHALVKQIIYTHAPRIIFLSATLVSDNQFINRIYEKVFPLEDRWKSEDNKHICVRSALYDMYDPKRKIKFKGFRGYSHVKYEQSLMKTKKLEKQYLELMAGTINASYIKNYREGLKCLIIFSTKEMCRKAADYFEEKFEGKTVGCYIHGANDDELYERDIICSTPKGAGTGVDIKNLHTGILTVGLSSTQLSRQIMGRTRPIKKYKDMDPFFIYMTNKQIPAQRQYDNKRRLDVRMRCKDFKAIDLGFTLNAA